MRNIFVIAPHPDDETLGCGGTILKHIEQNDNVYCIFVTNIDTKHGFCEEKVNKRQNEIEYVSTKYGFKKFYKLNYPAALLTPNDLNLLIADFSQIFKEIKPEIIYMPFYGDIHSDHRIIFDALSATTKTFRYPYIKKVLMYETVSETDFSITDVFKPNYYINIDSFINKKLEIAQIYNTEIQEFGLPRSIENIKAIGIFRGSQCNSKFAEAFQVVKIVEAS